MKPFLQTPIKKFTCLRGKKSLKISTFWKLISLMCPDLWRRNPLYMVFLFLLFVILYADYRPLAHKWPQGSKYTSWLNNLSTAWSDRNSDSILHFSISDVGHIPQSAELEREKKSLSHLPFHRDGNIIRKDINRLIKSQQYGWDDSWYSVWLSRSISVSRRHFTSNPFAIRCSQACCADIK